MRLLVLACAAGVQMALVMATATEASLPELPSARVQPLSASAATTALDRRRLSSLLGLSQEKAAASRQAPSSNGWRLLPQPRGAEWACQPRLSQLNHSSVGRPRTPARRHPLAPPLGDAQSISPRGCREDHLRPPASRRSRQRPPTGAREYRALDNLPALAAGVQMVPAFRAGQSIGFTLARLAPTSPLVHFGLQQGDTLIAVNGRALNSLSVVFDLVGQLQSLKSVEMTIERGGSLRTLAYQMH